MNRKNAFYSIVSLLLTCGVANAQQPVPAPPADAPPMAIAPGAPGEPPTAFSLFVDGGSFLGVHTENINKENMARYGMREVRGVGVTQVAKDSPAEKAGLRKDDVIVRFEGDSVTSVRKLTRLVSEVAPDQNVRLTISRSGSEQEVAVTMGKRKNAFNSIHSPEGWKGMEGFKGLKELEGLNELKGLKVMPPGNVWKWEGQGPDGDAMVWAFGNSRRIGVSTMQLTKQLAEYFGVDQGSGVLVTSVTDDGPAAKAGVKAGDVITAIDGEKVDGAGDVTRAINKKKDGDVTLTIIRRKDTKTITVTPKAAEPGAAPRVGRVSVNSKAIRDQIRTQIRDGIKNGTIVIPAINLPTVPAINIQTPRIDLPTIPEINVIVPRVRVVVSEQII